MIQKDDERDVNFRKKYSAYFIHAEEMLKYILF